MSGVENKSFESNGEDLENGSMELRKRKSSKQIEESNELLDEQAEKPPDNFVSRTLGAFWTAIGRQIKTHKKVTLGIVLVVLNILIFAYFAAATVYWVDNNVACQFEWCNGYGMLMILMILVYLGLFYFQIVKRYFGKSINNAVLKPVGKVWNTVTNIRFIPFLASLAVLAAFLAFILVDTWDDFTRLRSLLGIVILLFLGFIFSKHPGHIKWRPVVCGLSLQFLLGILTIRWTVGRDIFRCLGEKVTTFLQYSYTGSAFVFSDFLVYENPVFAFQVLPVIFFFSFMISVLYYWGAMQWIVMKLGWILQSILGTTVCESVNSSANIFLGMSESPLLIKPYIKDLTKSEIHAIMASGFATVSGTVLAAYISFGAEASHLITSSVLAAPGALCFSKLFFPETQKSKTTSENIEIAKATDSSVLDAATNGALTAISLVLGIIANIVAFVSFVTFLNGIVSWLGVLLGNDDITFQKIFSYIFTPLSWIMGVDWVECEYVGELIGLKTIVNEFAAYKRLGELKEAGFLSPRSAAIATYAICGFANPSSLGIMIGALGAMAPAKKPDITSVAIRAFITGSAVCFLTASIAGLLMDGDSFPTPEVTTIATLIS